MTELKLVFVLSHQSQHQIRHRTVAIFLAYYLREQDDVMWTYCKQDDNTHVFVVRGAPVDQMPEDEALPPSALIVRSAIACEGQKAFISCDDIYSGIQIESTMYGRKDSSTCVNPKKPSSSSSLCQEQEPDIRTQISGLCENEYKCEVTASDELLAKAGTVVCPTVYKYLQINYRCIPKEFLPAVEEPDPQKDESVSEVEEPHFDKHGIVFQDAQASMDSYTSSNPLLPQNKSLPDSETPLVEEVKSSDTAATESGDDVTETFFGNPGGGGAVKEIHEIIKKSQVEPRPQESGDGLDDQDESGTDENDVTFDGTD